MSTEQAACACVKEFREYVDDNVALDDPERGRIFDALRGIKDDSPVWALAEAFIVLVGDLLDEIADAQAERDEASAANDEAAAALDRALSFRDPQTLNDAVRMLSSDVAPPRLAFA